MNCNEKKNNIPVTELSDDQLEQVSGGFNVYQIYGENRFNFYKGDIFINIDYHESDRSCYVVNSTEEGAKPLDGIPCMCYTRLGNFYSSLPSASYLYELYQKGLYREKGYVVTYNE